MLGAKLKNQVHLLKLNSILKSNSTLKKTMVRVKKNLCATSRRANTKKKKNMKIEYKYVGKNISTTVWCGHQGFQFQFTMFVILL